MMVSMLDLHQEMRPTVSFRFASVMVSNGSRVHPAASIQEYPCLSLDNKQTKQDEALGCRPLWRAISEHSKVLTRGWREDQRRLQQMDRWWVLCALTPEAISLLLLCGRCIPAPDAPGCRRIGAAAIFPRGSPIPRDCEDFGDIHTHVDLDIWVQWCPTLTSKTMLNNAKSHVSSARVATEFPFTTVALLLCISGKSDNEMLEEKDG